MSDRPILFSAPMVRALLAGAKTQTRRVLKPQPPTECSIRYMLGNESWLPADERTPLRHHWEAWGGPLYQQRPEKALAGYFEVRMRYAPGDRLWVRESGVQLGNAVDGGGGRDGYEPCGFQYAADDATIYLPGMFEGHDYERRRNSIHMPRWASRLTLTVTDVRVERLQDLGEADALAEGCALECMTPTGDDSGSAIWGPGGFVALWESINGPGSWEANPWVAAYTFTVAHHNIDNPTGAS